MEKVNRILKRKDDGMVQIELMVTVFIVLLLLSIFITVLPVFIRMQELDHMANELVRTAEVYGGVSTEVQERYQELKTTTGITPKSISWEGTEYYQGTNRVQLNKKIKVRLTLDYDIGSSYLGSIPIELRSVTTGRSEVYIK